MNKYIDAEEIKNRLLQKGVEKSDIEFLLSVYKEHQAKNNIPTADVRENVKGEWIDTDLDNSENIRLSVVAVIQSILEIMTAMMNHMILIFALTVVQT